MSGHIFTPGSNINVIAECWGAGGHAYVGAFFSPTYRIGGAGGGGGSYARKHGIPLIGGTDYSVSVADGGDTESSFVSNLVVKAVGGGNAAFSDTGAGQGLGGKAVNCIGDYKYDGGDGGLSSGVQTTPQVGGGGGSSAARDGSKTNGSRPAGGTVIGGGPGGDGGHAGPLGAGLDGQGPGGGGGGGGTPEDAGDPGSTSGAGAPGAVVLWEDLGTWPPYGQTPLVTYGSPPPDPTPPTISMRATRVGIELLMKVATTGALPMYPNDLPATLFNFFPINWRVQARLDSAYSTDVTASTKSVAEERRGLLDRPYRVLTVNLTGLFKADVMLIQASLERLAKQVSTPIPLYTDHSRVTAESTLDFINCDTRYRRFFINQRVAIHNWVYGNRPDTVEYAQIKAITPDGLYLQSNLAGTYRVGARCYPCFEVQIALDQVQSFITDEYCEMNMVFMELPGRSAMPSTVLGFVNPDNFQTHDNLPIFDMLQDRSINVAGGVTRAGNKFQSGRAEVVFTTGERAQVWHELRIKSLDRVTFWKLLGFFDSRMGRLRTFWMLSPGTPFEPKVIQTNLVKVKPHGQLQDQTDFLKYVAVVMRDGTIYVRGVSSVTVDSPYWVFNFDETIPSVSLGDVRRVVPAFLARLKNDSMQEVWTTDELCDVVLQGLELLAEGAQELVNPDMIFVGGKPAQYDDIRFWGQPARNTLSAGLALALPGTEPGLVGDAVLEWHDTRGAEFEVMYLLGTSTPGQVVYKDPSVVNGKPAMPWTGSAKFTVKASNYQPYDNTLGFTAFLVYHVGPSSGTWSYFIYKAGILEWAPTLCKMRATEDVNVPAANITTQNLLGNFLSKTCIATLVWKPGVSAKIYLNGVEQGAAATPAASLAVDTARLMDLFNMTSQFTAEDIVLYGRGLDVDELNAIGQFFGQMYAVPWTDIT